MPREVSMYKDTQAHEPCRQSLSLMHRASLEGNRAAELVVRRIVQDRARVVAAMLPGQSFTRLGTSPGILFRNYSIIHWSSEG